MAFFNDPEPGTYLAFGRMDNPDFWYEFSVTSLSLGTDRIVSVFTPDDDHHVGAFVERSLRLFRMVLLVGVG